MSEKSEPVLADDELPRKRRKLSETKGNGETASGAQEKSEVSDQASSELITESSSLTGADKPSVTDSSTCVSDISTDVTGISTSVTDISTSVTDVSTSVTGTSTSVTDVSTGVSEASTSVAETDTAAHDAGKTDDSSCATGAKPEKMETSESVDAEGDDEGEDDSSSPYLLEKDVGIIEYISKHEGFRAILKQRFSDFVVNEIDQKGNIVRLTDISKPEDTSAPPHDPALVSVLLPGTFKQLQELAESKNRKASVKIEVDDDKEKRTSIHKAVRQLKMGLDSRTEDIGGKKSIVVSCMKNKGNRRGSRWAPHRPDYCQFTMYKENRDTMHAVDYIAKMMHMKANAFTYAGTKDKRGKTTQRVSVYRVEAERLHELNKTLRGIILGNFRFSPQPIKLGDLSGNHFSIILRSATGSEEQFNEAMQSLQEIGFINYFGMQRFGTTSIPTHHVGRCLLHSKWSEAVDLILKARAKDHQNISECRQVWAETKDPVLAMEKLRGKNCVEMHLLQGLKKFGQKDLVVALQMIPRSTRMMYVHSYQSYAWNTVVSRRIQEFGLKPAVGDLVMPGCSKVEDNHIKGAIKPTVITEDSLSQYTIHDVVLPLPGYDVIYPENSVKEWYKEVLAEDDLDIDNLRHKVRDYSLPGSYRKMVVKPKDVSWKVFHYNDPTESLILSDHDKLNNVKEPETIEGGEYTAFKLEFSLPSSTYATMALREILKADTSSAHQSTLSKPTS